MSGQIYRYIETSGMQMDACRRRKGRGEGGRERVGQISFSHLALSTQREGGGGGGGGGNINMI